MFRHFHGYQGALFYYRFLVVQTLLQGTLWLQALSYIRYHRILDTFIWYSRVLGTFNPEKFLIMVICKSSFYLTLFKCMAALHFLSRKDFKLPNSTFIIVIWGKIKNKKTESLEFKQISLLFSTQPRNSTIQLKQTSKDILLISHLCNVHVSACIIVEQSTMAIGN